MDDDHQFCLRWKNHQSTLVSQLDSLLVNESLVDCTLAAEGKYVRAHKVVLSACSPYFETLIGLHYDKHPVFILNNVKYEELQAIMDYMYRGEVNISQDELGAILKAARSLQIRGLSEKKGSEDKKLKRPASPQQNPVASEPAHFKVSKEKSNQQSTAVDSDSASESPATARGTSPKLRKRRKVSRYNEDKKNISAKIAQDDPDIRIPVQSSFDQSHFDKRPCQQTLDVSKNMTTSTFDTEFLLEPKSEYVAETYNADSNGVQDYDQLQDPTNAAEGPSEGCAWNAESERIQEDVFKISQVTASGHRVSQDPSLLHSQGTLDRHNSAQLNMEQSLLTLFNSPGVSSAVHPKIPEGYFVPGNYSKGGKRIVNLDEVLNCYDGKQILDAGNLNHNSRRKLCEIIVNFELRDDYDKRIRSSLLKKYSEAIVAKFPTEKAEIYYIGPRTIKGKKLQARGKLWSKYTNTRRSLKKRGLIKRRTTNDTDTGYDYDDVESDVEFTDNFDLLELQYLENNMGPWDVILSYWHKTHKHRRSNITNAIEYFDKYKVLKEPNGYLLLEDDFNQMYPNQLENFTCTWENYSAAIIAYAKTLRNKDIDQILENVNVALHSPNVAVQVLPMLFEAFTVMVSKKFKYRISKEEISKSFCTVIPTTAMLHETIKQRSQEAQAGHCSVHPYIIITGSFLNPGAIYVIINETVYKCPTLARGIDVAFKLFHALDMEYPDQCKPVWLYLQKTLYGISTKNDTDNVNVLTLQTDIDVFLQKQVMSGT